MQAQIKPEFFHSYLDNYLSNFFEYSLSATNFHMTIHLDNLIVTLNPYISKEYEKILSRFFTYVSWDLSILSKIHHEPPFTYQASYNPELLDELKKQLLFLQEELESKTRLLLENQKITLNFEKCDEDFYIINGVSISKDNLIPSTPIIKVEVFCGIEELYHLYKTNPQITQMKFAETLFQYRYNSKEKEEYYIVLFKDDKVIGLTALGPSFDYPNCLCPSFTSIVEEEQGQGYSKLLMEKRFELLKSLGKGLHQSLYSPSGFDRLRPYVLELNKKFNLPLYENGLLHTPRNFSQAIYSEQKSIHTNLQNAINYQNPTVYVNGQNIKIEDELLKNFLFEDVHNLNDLAKNKAFYSKYQKFLNDWVCKFLT